MLLEILPSIDPRYTLTKSLFILHSQAIIGMVNPNPSHAILWLTSTWHAFHVDMITLYYALGGNKYNEMYRVQEEVLSMFSGILNKIPESKDIAMAI